MKNLTENGGKQQGNEPEPTRNLLTTFFTLFQDCLTTKLSLFRDYSHFCVCVCCVVGLYQLFNVQKKEMSLSDFKELANSERYKLNWF